MPFELHPRLAQDTVPIGEMGLSRLVLMDDARFAWSILVPRCAGASEIADLAAGQRSVLIEEIASVSAALKRLTGAPRVNVGALGNLVPQLHVHVVARFPTDAAWPGPVWGDGARQAYEPAAAAALTRRIALDLRLA